MARSIKKGPYVDANLNKKVEAIAEGKAKKGISSRPLKEKLSYPLYNKVWDECANELKNSPIKFYEKNSTKFQFRNFFK
jgi:hypothetical protein